MVEKGQCDGARWGFIIVSLRQGRPHLLAVSYFPLPLSVFLSLSCSLALVFYSCISLMCPFSLPLYLSLYSFELPLPLSFSFFLSFFLISFYIYPCPSLLFSFCISPVFPHSLASLCFIFISLSLSSWLSPSPSLSLFPIYFY